MHAGSAPLAGKHTGPAGLRRLLALHPDLVVVVAHLGMPEYFEFAELAADYPDVHLDTTMAATDFTGALRAHARWLASSGSGSCARR